MNAAIKEEVDGVMFCASCGTAGGNDIKLMKCNGCYLVKYCSVKCQKEHRPKHKKECKKRAAELRDEILFKQPEGSHLGDCPICCLPMPIDINVSVLSSCCSKFICRGCNVANQKREIKRRIHPKCPFCRKSVPKTNEEVKEHKMKRLEANDPNEMCDTGKDKYEDGDFKSAFEYWTKAAALGNAEAHYMLSKLYYLEQGVEKDEKKYVHHTEQAAIGGHPEARNNLANMELGNGQYDRALRHFTIGSNLGYEKSLNNVKRAYQAGYASKEDFATALCGYQSAIEATKSPQREEAEEYYRNTTTRRN